MTGKVAAIIPTYNRGTKIFATLARLLACKPAPCEILVHVDQSDGSLEGELSREFPQVRTFSSVKRLGPGGGRHQCLIHSAADFAASFDDDSWPVDENYFACAAELLEQQRDAGVIGAQIWHRTQAAIPRSDTLLKKQNYVGCGCVFRLSAYLETRGLLARPVPYAGEETDLSLLLFAKGWNIYHSGNLRVFHDTELRHHESPDVTAGTIANVALYAFLHYPVRLWPLGLLQVGNMVRFCVANGRWRGVLRGLAVTPKVCIEYTRYRDPLSVRTIREYRAIR